MRAIRDQLSDWFRSHVAKHRETPPLLNCFANCLYFGDKNALRLSVYVIQILFKIHRLQWCILYCDSENNGTTIFDFSTNRTNVHEARIMYPLPSRYISWWRPIKDLQEPEHSTTTQSNFSSSSAILRFRLSRFERFTYDVHSHLRSFLSRVYLLFPAGTDVRLEGEKSIR